MADRFFHAELSLLRELASQFACANPALAPLLDGIHTDPDVERLLEAVAFQNAMLRQKLDCDFPQMVHDLAQLILPHYLRPTPASTIIGFTPNDLPGRTAIIPAGTQLASAPVDVTRCRFTTTAALEFHPLEMIDASFARHRGGGEIRLALTLKGVPLHRWQPKRVRLFLSDDHPFATELYLLLSRHVTRIEVIPVDGGEGTVLPSKCLSPLGFTEDESLFPYPTHAFPGYRLLQEYFSTPGKFLFFELNGWDCWQQRGEGMQFTISFELDRPPSQPHQIKRESFVLNAVPAINLFFHDAAPIAVDHRAGSYVIRPEGEKRTHCQVFSVDRVTGYSRITTRERRYVPFELFSCGSSVEPVFHTQLAQSSRHGGYEMHLSVAFPGEIPPSCTETLSIALTCTNGSLPEHLCIGDIKEPFSALPDFVSARNITPVNPGQSPPLGAGVLARLASHLYLNQVSLERVEHLRRLLELYVFPGQRSGVHGAANLKRIAGIESLEATAGEESISGLTIRGREIRIKVRLDHFAGPGDLYLFGCVLDHFLGGYTSLQSYSRLVFYDSLKGGTCQWPARLGDQHLR